MKTYLNNLFRWFLVINSGILLIVGVIVMKYDSIPSITIPRIFLASIATSAVTAAFVSLDPKKPIEKPVSVFICLVHYILLCVVIMVLGVMFDWFEPTLKGACGVMLSVAGVYIFSALVAYALSKGEAAAMNDALKDFKDE